MQEEGEEEGRSRRRNRKEINYAELNDLYLPPLSPEQLGGRESRKVKKPSRNMFDYVQDDYLAPRVRSSNRRRLRAVSPLLAVLKEEEIEGDYEELNDRTGQPEDSGCMEVREEEEEEEEEENEVLESYSQRSVEDSSLQNNIATESLDEVVAVKSILGKRLHDRISPEATHTEDVCRYSPSHPVPQASSLTAPNVSSGCSIASNGSSVQCVANSQFIVEENCRKDVGNISVKKEESAMQAWNKSEVCPVAQEFLQEASLADRTGPGAGPGSVPVFGAKSSHCASLASSDKPD